MYPEKFLDEITALPPVKQLLFGLSCAQRIINLYSQFDQNWGEKNTHLLTEFLENGFAEALNFNSFRTNPLVISTIEQIENITPDTDEYDSGFDVTYAQNVAFVMGYCYDYIEKLDSQQILHAGQCLLEIVDVIENSKYTVTVNTDQIVDQEIALQLDYLEYIGNMDLSPNSILALRQLNQQNLIVA